MTKTLALWEKQDKHKGDRWALFKAVGAFITPRKVLYPGSYVDISPSFVFNDVTYVDLDKRAATFFADEFNVDQIIVDHRGNSNTNAQFIHGDYHSLALTESEFDLLISLYAGFISEPCGALLKIGGLLLVNASHGDAALAALDPRFTLIAVVLQDNGRYRVSDVDLQDYMKPKKPEIMTRERILSFGRAIPYTKSPFAYVFKRVS
ncbi:hypothetical protein ACODM8_18660 [Vibrio ostreicida]|uniref:Class I SAM-dependent methyltransferase n=1 Tax=Vibrio ostreicida TaxID=526588 RepID=A0ABT8BXL6_9VIBR|nr:hypothetical protein [Vibrio ostreicida]MDN3611424.1 hypothetical protein [Vibrio ostreicida]NPD08931.1 hypothetical protein [Vibrio ostreicida]